MLFVRNHILADHYPIGSVNIKPGQVIALNSNGEAILHDNNGTAPTNLAIGIAGDEKGSLSPNTFTNLAWELGDETAGSKRITVYHSGGTFYVDYGTNADVNPNDSSAAVGDVWSTDNSNADGTVSNAGTGTNVFTVVSILPNTNYGTSGYFDTGIPGPVNAPVGDVDSARKFVLAKLEL